MGGASTTAPQDVRGLIDRGSSLRQGATTREEVFALREQLAGALKSSTDFKERMYISSALLNVTQVGGNGLLTPQETVGGPGVIGLVTESMAWGGSNASVRPGIGGGTPAAAGPTYRSSFRAFNEPVDASLPIGSKRLQFNQPENPSYQPVRNQPGVVNGRDYSGHAFDRMQDRGLMPSVIENAVSVGTKTPSRLGTSVHYDPVNNVTVVLNAQGRVITVRGGR
jgi:hypothetical protein